jgi:uncharacterized integral membrane protein
MNENERQKKPNWALRIRLVAIAVVCVLVVWLLAKNSQPVRIWFFGAQLEQLPLWALLLVAFIGGALGGALALSLMQHRK